MNTDATEAMLREAYSAQDPAALAETMTRLVADEIVQEWPQSGERIRGVQNIVAVTKQYAAATGTAPHMTLRRITRPGEAWVVESTIDYGDGTPVSWVSILEANADGKIVRQTDYFANPFEAPAWRREWVEQMAPAEA